MKKILVSLFFLAIVSVSNAQINVGSSPTAVMNKAGKLSDDDIAELKKTTTLFTLQLKDYEHVADFEKAIASAWKITPFKIIKPEELDEYSSKEGYSFFSFGGYYTEKAHGNPMQANYRLFSIHFAYDLWMAGRDRKGHSKGQSYYSRVLLSTNMKAFETALGAYGRDFDDKMTSYMYDGAEFYNWGAGFLKGYLLTINDQLTKSETRGLFTSDEDEAAMRKLRTDTLYIPDYVNIHFNGLSGEESDNGRTAKDLREAYPRRIKLVSASELNAMILNKPEPFYYLVYVRSAADKYVNVYNTQKGMLFARYTPMSYNFKYKDLSKINDVLK